MEIKVKNSWGVYDAYKLIRKNKWFNIGRPLKENEFYTIIRSINKYIAECLANGDTFIFPSRMGALELRKYPCGAKIVNGKLQVTYPIDWINTKKLWNEDKEAERKKIFVRYENPWVYHIKYTKYKANYDNKSFYQFTLNRFIKKALSKNIKQGKVDTLWVDR